MAEPLTLWVAEHHFVGEETSPSARVFRTRDEALRILAEEDAATDAELTEEGEEIVPFWEQGVTHEDGSVWWSDCDGSWRCLAPHTL